MNAEQFQEYLYTILLSTKSNKDEVCHFLDVSITSMENWLNFGLPKARKFLIIDKLEVYLFNNLGGSQRERNTSSTIKSQRKPSLYSKYKDICVVPRVTFNYRVKKGMPPEEAAVKPLGPSSPKNYKKTS